MFVINKNINHNGKAYAKDSEIAKDDANFELLMKAGHVNEGTGKPMVAQAEAAAPMDEGSDEVEDKKSKKHSKR